MTWIQHRRAWIRDRSRQDGQGLAEYALILALIALVAIVALAFFGSTLASVLGDIGTSVSNART